jgi:hypothetical protein
VNKKQKPSNSSTQMDLNLIDAIDNEAEEVA